MVVHREDEARAALLRRIGDADVEPHGRVEGRHLVHQEMRELIGEDLRVPLGREVRVLPAPAGDGVDHASNELSNGGLTLGRPEGAAEVLLRDDVRRVL